MKCTAKLKVFDNSKTLYDVFMPEIKAGKNKRSSVEVKKGKKYFEFDFKAKDSTALRASVNSIMRLLTVYEKMKNIK